MLYLKQKTINKNFKIKLCDFSKSDENMLHDIFAVINEGVAEMSRDATLKFKKPANCPLFYYPEK